MIKVTNRDVIGLLHASVDVHTLGILAFSQAVEECGTRTAVCDADVALDVERIARGTGGTTLAAWLKGRGVTILGFSYRLDPDDAVRLFSTLRDFLRRHNLLGNVEEKIRALFFAGLPKACDLIRQKFPDTAAIFEGDESPRESLRLIGIPDSNIPHGLEAGAKYDDFRLEMGRKIIREGKYLGIKPVDRMGYKGAGTRGDSILRRIEHGRIMGLPPVIRAHAGPYMNDRKESVSLFLDWTKRLASGGLLDVLSIGTSQLTQSRFGLDWEGYANGGGVPIASAEEFAAVWRAARPMLVRTYAGTRDIVTLARMYEDTIDIAWHALSFWWFCQIDGRGPNSVLENLREHFSAIAYIASSGKPLEPNVPHHFAFRGADDLSYVVSGYVAAKAARRAGIKSLILQIMLNTPKYTWGIKDIIKARTLLKLVRSLESSSFKVYVQTRGGLDYFSPDPIKARSQLSAVTALMDDIEPDTLESPDIIHVVSFSEASYLADPATIEESIRITRYTLDEYRRHKRENGKPAQIDAPETICAERTLFNDARFMIDALEKYIPDTYSPEGLYDMMRAGAFALPWLTGCTDEFAAAMALHTRIIDGGVEVVDARGIAMTVQERVEYMRQTHSRTAGRGGGNVE